jgi:hypothetical protein
VGILRAVLGAVLILLALFVVGPVLIFVGGAVWSALLGYELTEDAEAGAPADQGSASA